jgi:hypothetical protein
LDRLTGIYFEPDHGFGPMLHFVFRLRWHDRLAPAACSPEIGDVGYWPLDALPAPISDFTERRVRDAAAGSRARLSMVTTRRWRE